jgi:hypothetical protein
MPSAGDGQPDHSEPGGYTTKGKLPLWPAKEITVHLAQDLLKGETTLCPNTENKLKLTAQS